MPTLLQLLEAKNKRLEAIPDKFLSGMVEVQKQLVNDVIALLGEFDIDGDGKFILNKKNLALAGEIDIKLREALERSEYTEFVTEFAGEFNNQVSYNDDYFKSAFPGFTTSELGKQMVVNAQRNAVQLLVNISPDASYILPIKQQIELSVVNNASFAETVKGLQEIIVGDADVEGKILHYAKQIAHDTFAVSDASYAAAVADEVGASWYKYSGSAIETTRPFCRERKGKYFCRREIELWGDGKNTDTKEFEWPQNKQWAGEMAGTNARTIFSTRGGYNCRDSIMAIPIFKVPKEEIIRAMRLGYYKPTKFEIEEIGLEDVI